jgi:phage baseplate assembly protein gpV
LNRKTMLRRASLLAAAVGALALAPAGSALAATCDLRDPAPVGSARSLFDGEGYEWDTRGDVSPAETPSNSAYGVLADGGSAGPLGTPPGVRAADDTFDWWGQLFVGGVAPENAYFSTTNGDCAFEADGRELAYPVLDVSGLKVQRKIYVPPSGAGARLLDIVANPTSAPITTSVVVGDLTTRDIGDLGSDSFTNVRATSSGDASLTADDDWGVSTDAATSGGDAAFGYVWNGGGSQRAALAQIGGPALDDPATTLGQEQLGWGWASVTIAPGEAAAFTSWLVQKVTASGSFADQWPLAEQGAQALRSAPLASVFAGMDAAEIKAVRNWARPKPTAAIAPVPAANHMADVALAATGSRFSPDVPACDAGTVSWDFGDGTTGTGANVAHRYTPGTYTAKLTVANACGEVATTTAAVTVAAAKAKVNVAGGKSVKLATLLKKGVKLGVTSDQAGAIALKGAVAKKLAKKLHIPAALLAGKGKAIAMKKATLKLKPSKKVAKALQKAFSPVAGKKPPKSVAVTLKATVKTAYGQVTTVTRKLTIKR